MHRINLVPEYIQRSSRIYRCKIVPFQDQVFQARRLQTLHVLEFKKGLERLILQGAEPLSYI